MIDTTKLVTDEGSILMKLSHSALTVAVISFYESFLPFLLLAGALIVADLRWGIAKVKYNNSIAVQKGEKQQEIRTSWAIRRSVNKFMDYLLWITIAGLLGQSFGNLLGIPTLSLITLVFVYYTELNSCFNNYYASKGLPANFNIIQAVKNFKV